MKDLISVIIPIYKVEAYLVRCIESIRNQTYVNLEIILVEDGSPDGCGAICDEYEKKDSRIKVIHQENKGLSGARNSGMKIATGRYFSFVDSDDFVGETFIQKLYESCVSTESDISVCRWQDTDSKHAFVPKETDQVPSCFTGMEMLERIYEPEGSRFVVAWNKLYKRELFEEIQFPQGRIHEDEGTIHYLYGQAKKVAVIEDVLYAYWTEGASITRGFNPKKSQWLDSIEERILYFQNNGHEKLLPKALQDYTDGAVRIGLEWKKYRPSEKKELGEIKKTVRKNIKRMKAYGGFPARTRVGYELFLFWPDLYEKVLQKVSEDGK